MFVTKKRSQSRGKVRKIQRTETTFHDENQPVAERTYGDVWTRVWENYDQRGRRYYTFSQHLIYEVDSKTRTKKSFRLKDFDDVIRGAQWVASKIRKKKESGAVTLSPRSQVARSNGRN